MAFFITIKDFLKNFTGLTLRDRFFQIIFITAVGINLFIWILLYFTFYPLRAFGDLVPLHYNVYFGIDLVGRWYKIFTIPFVGFFFILINFILSCFFYLREKMIGYFLGVTVLFSQILLAIAAAMIILINR
jgi:hypothetical protein